MDRRKKRTSTNQYMMYINMMEKDPIFATGRIPRNVDVNYLHKKWKELSDRLNTCNTGPSLTAEEWRKRLNDWKNTTRCKYRRSLSGEKDISLTSLEQKALDLFGKAPNNTSSSELSIHLKSEKDDDEEEDDEDMEHQRTSDTLQKELQAAVEEAICGDDNEDGMEDSHDEHDDLLHDPLTSNANNTLSTLSTVNNNGNGDNHPINNSTTTTTYRTIVMENAQYTDEDNNDEHLELIPHRRVAAINNNSVTTGVQTIVSSGNNTHSTKLINGELPAKRLRTQAHEPIIYEVKKATRPITAMVTSTPIITAQPTITQQAHYHQQDINNGQTTTTYHLTGTNTSITASNNGNMGMTSQDAREMARQLKRVADIKLEKLKFEIARFKFNNPGFDFNSPLL